MSSIKLWAIAAPWEQLLVHKRLSLNNMHVLRIIIKRSRQVWKEFGCIGRFSHLLEYEHCKYCPSDQYRRYQVEWLMDCLKAFMNKTLIRRRLADARRNSLSHHSLFHTQQPMQHVILSHAKWNLVIETQHFPHESSRNGISSFHESGILFD